MNVHVKRPVNKTFLPFITVVTGVFLMSAALPGQVSSQNVNISDIQYQHQDNRELNPAGALLRSVALPGWGHYYNDRTSWRRGQIHLGADLALITSWIYLHTNANMLESNMYSFANSYAGINLRPASRRMEIAVGNYMNLDAHNEAQLRSRNWDRLIEDTPENRWEWQTDQQRRDYLSVRSRMENARQQIPAVISLMVVNRVISGVHAFMQARNHNQNLPDLTFGIPLESGGEGFTATLHFRF